MRDVISVTLGLLTLYSIYNTFVMKKEIEELKARLV